MGQKVNPYGFRLGVTTDWKSRWFADREEYVDRPVEDWKIRDYLMNKLLNAAISCASRSSAPGDRLRIDVHTARPGIVIGRRGACADEPAFPTSPDDRQPEGSVFEHPGDQAARARRGAHRLWCGRPALPTGSPSAVP